MSWLKRPGAPYILAFIVTLIIAVLTYTFDPAVANFVIAAGLLLLASGIGFITVDVARHRSDDSNLIV